MLKAQTYHCVTLNGQVGDMSEIRPDFIVADLNCTGYKRIHQK
jgi:hypothetical protein